MRIVQLTDKGPIEAFCRRNAALHLYSLGDLDDRFWPRTTWWGSMDGDRLTDLILLYDGGTMPTLIALSDAGPDMAGLLDSILDVLPDRFYAHVSPHLTSVLQYRFSARLLSRYYRMVWRHRSMVKILDCSSVRRLACSDLEAVQALYKVAYPDGRLDPRMIATGHFRGVQMGEQLISAAGIHVYSREYGVAALGNIATHPAFRNRGYGTRVTACLCLALESTADTVGLNVKPGNRPAIACYRKLGFEPLSMFTELLVER